jgi:hypothetical protein
VVKASQGEEAWGKFGLGKGKKTSFDSSSYIARYKSDPYRRQHKRLKVGPLIRLLYRTVEYTSDFWPVKLLTVFYRSSFYGIILLFWPISIIRKLIAVYVLEHCERIVVIALPQGRGIIAPTRPTCLRLSLWVRRKVRKGVEDSCHHVTACGAEWPRARHSCRCI